MVPPAIYKSSCTIDVTYFPFDEQHCEMRFGSWTFDANQVKLVREKPMANLDDYLPSGTWDVIDAPSETVYNNIDGTERMELVYKFVIRRKSLFYTVNLIIPTVLISFLSVFVFYLPTDEGEKMTLCISILLALVVFLLLVSKILPPTSIVIPLISKYLLFSFIMNIITIFNTVVIINWNYRTPRTHNMPRWVRVLFINFLPKILFMKRPKKMADYSDSKPNQSLLKRDKRTCISSVSFENEEKTNERLLNNSYKKVVNPTMFYGYGSGKPKTFATNRLNNSKQRQKQQQHRYLDNYVFVKKANDSSATRVKNDLAQSMTHNMITSTPDKSIKFRSGKYCETKNKKLLLKSFSSDSDLCDDQQTTTSNDEYCPEVLEAADKVTFITNHIKSESDYQEVNFC